MRKELGACRHTGLSPITGACALPGLYIRANIMGGTRKARRGGCSDVSAGSAALPMMAERTD